MEFTKEQQKRRSSVGARWFRRLILASLVVALANGTSLASTVSLQWDAVAGSDVAGYKVYYQADSSVAPFSGTGAVQGAAPVDVAGLTSATISGLDPAHAYFFAVTAYNAAGAESSYSNLFSIPEMEAPIASVTYPANNAAVSGTVSVSASASDNVGVTRLEFYVNGVLQATDTSTPYVFAWNTTTVAPGAYTISAKAYDAAGNVGTSGNVAVTVVNDTTAPTVSVTSPGAGATVSGSVPITLSASDNVGVSKVEFYQDGVLLSAGNVSPYSYSWNTATVVNGAHTLSAKAYDAAGNVGQSAQVSVTVANVVADTVAPTISLTSPVKNSKVSGTVTISTNVSDNVGVAKVNFYVNGALKGTVTSAPFSYDWKTNALANGNYTLQAKAYDAAGNVGQSTKVNVSVSNETVAPTVSLTSPTAGATLGGIVSVTANATDNVSVTKVEFYLNGALVGTANAAPYAFSWNTATVANGPYTISAKAYDPSGNIGQSASVAVTVINDTTAPAVSLASPISGATVGGAVAVTANASDNVGVTKVEFYLNGLLQSTSSAAPYSFNWNTLASVNGPCTISAKAYDAAGNVGQSANLSVTVFNDTTAPVASIAAPINNSTVGGMYTVSAIASDNVGVIKVEFYLNGILQATAASAPYSFSWTTATFANGSYSLSARAYDAAGNVGQSANVTVNVFNDNVAPTLGAFTMPASATSLTVPITALAATDNVGVTGYLVSESSTTPTAGAAEWSASAPSSFTFAGTGARTAYAWAKDAAGNISANSSASVTISLTPGLVAAYSFDEGTGTTVIDKSGNGNNGTIQNAIWTTSGRFGNALVFNGSSALVNIPDSASLHLTTGMTLEAWVKPSTISNAWSDVIYKGLDTYYLEGSSPYYGKAMGGGKFSSGETGSYTSSALPVNSWTHLAVTYDGSKILLYVGGVLVSTTSQSGSLAASTNALQIGGDSFYSNEFFAGTIDEIRVYNVPLTQTQIQADMNNAIGL